MNEREILILVKGESKLLFYSCRPLEQNLFSLKDDRYVFEKMIKAKQSTENAWLIAQPIKLQHWHKYTSRIL